MAPNSPTAEAPSPGARTTRVRDGDIVLFGGEIVNRQQLAKLLHVTPLRISQWTRLPNGLPYIRVPSGDPTRRGLRMLFNVAAARKWLESFQEHPNPLRQKSKRHRAGDK
jgi:hypothetical protein